MQEVFQTVMRILGELDRIPSTPFIPSPRIRFIESFLVDHAIPFKKTDVAIIVHPRDNHSDPHLFFMTHLDHPGIVFKNSTHGKVLGTIYQEKIREILAKNNIPLRISSPIGEYLGTGFLVRLSGTYFTDAHVKTDLNIERNSTAQWDIGESRFDDHYAYLYNADNDVATAVLLSILPSLESATVVFNFFEEVHQYSSYYLAKNNVLKINHDDILINLECALNEGNLNITGSTTNSYDNGCVLQLGQKDLIYGYLFPHEINMAEYTVREAAKKMSIQLQTGLTKGADDSRSFSHFPLTPNIVTLTVPNRFKHNIDQNGNITQEKIFLKDIYDMQTIVVTISKHFTQYKGALSSKTENSSFKAKQQKLITDIALIRQRKRINERLYIAYRARTRRKYFYATGILDACRDILNGLLSYFVYYFRT